MKYGFILVAVLAVLGLFGGMFFERGTQKTVTFKVTDKAIMPTHNNGHRYMVYTNKGVYKDTDSFWFFKYRSSDLYSQLQRGHWYICKTSGVRIGITSSYPNLISCKAR